MHVHVWRSEEACARVEVTGGVCMCGGSEEACSCVAVRGGMFMCGGQRRRVHVWGSEDISGTGFHSLLLLWFWAGTQVAGVAQKALYTQSSLMDLSTSCCVTVSH